jgi:hypothetical protein
MPDQFDQTATVMKALRSYEQERQEKFAAGIDAIPVDMSDLQRAMELLAREDIRFIAFADEELEGMFKMFLPDDIPGEKKSMLGRFGPISTLFARIQFAFAFDMMHSDILLALDELRKHRNNIAHTWNQDDLRDFTATPLPYMDELESAMLHMDIKDGGDGDLSPEASFRLRTVWLLARLIYESGFYTLAVRATLKPFSALYSNGAPVALRKISAPAHQYTQIIFDRDRGFAS